MFKKMQNRKGFTLIEMLAVIAIVAILVAVIIPIVNGSTDKAAAATNAANLRGVEGEIITMMLVEPEAFNQKNLQQAVDTKRDELTAEGTKLDTEEAELAAAKKDAEDKKATWESAESEATRLNTELQSALSKLENATKDYDTAPSYLKWMYEAAYKLAQAGKVTAQGLYDEAVAYADTKEKEYEDAKLKYEGLLAENTTAQKNNEAAQIENDAKEKAIYYLTATNGKITLANGTVIDAPVSKKVNIDPVNIDKDVDMIVYVNTFDYEAYACYGDYYSQDFAAVANPDTK